MKTATIIWVVIGLVALGLLVWWIISFNTAPQTPLNVPEDGPVTLEGTIVCLPHRDTTGPQTMECAYGLHGEDNNYYALTDEDNSAGAGAITQFPTDTAVEVTGVFALGEDERYATVGSIEIDTIVAADGANVPGSGTTTSDGVIMFSQPENFGLAVTNEQILVDSVVPPCTSEFKYCLYYNGTEYRNTNFSSAGVSIRERTDLASENACLTTQPAGYTSLEMSTSTGDGYMMSLFAPLDDAATGSYSTGEDYRLFASSTCYEFVTRVGEIQFANAATGTEEFTDTERQSLLDTLRSIVDGIVLEPNNTNLSLPARP